MGWTAAVKVHIVEDDWGVRDALVELVSGLGYSVEAYGEAESFIAAGLPGSGDLVLVDLALPGIRGEELLQQLRRLARPPRMVAISGQPKAEIDSALRRLPGIALLRKPLAAEAIAALF
jgi:FixJ family two-component response regulator